jgi:ubiquinone/menaquinone biosynthesis C-methylase UbiE
MIDRRLNYGRQHINRFTKNLAQNAVVLDLGAGGGDDLLIAKSNNPTAQLHAVECYVLYQENLRSKGITVHNLNIENQKLPFADGSVDVIIANQILEHCKEIWWIMNEVSRVLKTGGYFITGVPNLASLHNRLLLAIGRQPTAIQNNTAHVRGYTRRDLKKFIEVVSGHAYKPEGFGGGNFYPFPPAIAKPLAAVFPTFAWGIFFKFKKVKSCGNEFIKYPVENQLETNFYLG